MEWFRKKKDPVYMRYWLENLKKSDSVGDVT